MEHKPQLLVDVPEGLGRLTTAEMTMGQMIEERLGDERMTISYGIGVGEDRFGPTDLQESTHQFVIAADFTTGEEEHFTVETPEEIATLAVGKIDLLLSG